MQNFIEVEKLLSKKDILKIELIGGEKGLKNKIFLPKIQKKGLIFAGFVEALKDERILIIGNTEISYLKQFSDFELDEKVDLIFTKKIPAIIVTNNLNPPKSLIKYCNRFNVPIFKSSLPTSELIQRVTKILEDELSPKQYLHGVMLDIHGVGTLIEGESGIGKSEIALELIQRGHRLVADDIVCIKFIPPDFIIAECVDELKYHIEIRGLGIINIEELFGISALRDKKRLDLIVHLIKLEENLTPIERLGLEDKKKKIFGVEIPLINLPVSSGRNIAMLIELAARIFLLKKYVNYNPTERFLDKLYKNGKN